MNERQINGREYLEQEVRLRAHHETAEQVRTTCSFARAERLIGREYHGRFLIELLQNAADAWRNDLRSAGGDRSRVAVFIADGPALVVANQGACMGAEVVIESLGHIGASTKSEGEAIGHKGIGFKSVLEITLTPEIYSGLQKEQPTLAVKFDPDLAISTILDASSDWPRLVSDVQGIDFEDELAAVPVLRFPHWIDDIPAVVKDLKCKGFDTVVRLPFNEKYATRLGLDKNDWLTTVRGALAGVSDQILLLLGCFSEMLVEDRLKSQRDVVTPKWDVNAEPYGEMCTREVVHILRNSEPSSHWRVFRKTFGESKHLAGEIAVGIRINNTLDQIAMLPAIDVEPSAPFHLFFPTRIASGLPFLLHGYFEVDVSRTGFYRGSASRNGAILDELAALTAYAVRNIAESGDVDLVTLVDLVAAASQPEDPLARKFYEKVFEHLDEIDWVPVEAEGADQQSDRPTKLFVCSPNLTRKIASVFSSTYIKRRIGLSLPDIRLSNDAFELVRSRQPVERRDQWATLEKLFRPGKIPIWEDREAGLGFKHLLDLLVALEADDNTAAKALIDGLRGDTDSRLLPTVSPDGGYTFLPVPDPSESVSGRRSRLIMARARTMTGETLVPPHELDLAFLPEGLLESEADIDRAKPLGVRPFTVDNVLDRLNGIADANIDPPVLFCFLWRLLHRERNSVFGTRRSVERALIFDPNEWFWCRPGRAREEDYARLSQQRERYLANVPVPCRDGEWRPAGSVVFGADWGEWLESGAIGNPVSAAITQRASAYRALEKISLGVHVQLASPKILMAYLVSEAFDEFITKEEEELEDALNDHKRNAERHAFLLRLGVWEVPPIEAYESRKSREGNNFPWDGPTAIRQKRIIAQSGGWTFDLEGWAGQQHHNVYLAEDYRFVWSLEDLAKRDAKSLMMSLQFGEKLYAQRLSAQVFCPGCSDSGGRHRTHRYSAAADEYPSSLALQFGHDHWVICTRNGMQIDSPIAPTSSWWHSNPPTGAGLRQSPYRLLKLCGPSSGMTEELRQLAQISSPKEAGLEKLRVLLLDLRSRFESSELEVDPATSGSARQTFVSLHRLIYERLSELVPHHADKVEALLSETKILCELGNGLVYRLPTDAFHNDGSFATFVRYFIGEIPFVTLPRVHDLIATHLGVQTFEVQLSRRSENQGRDVTNELQTVLNDRIPELLSIVVYHSLGTQTLEVDSQQFGERARRLQALTFCQMDDLVINASIKGSSLRVTIGEGADQNLFLEHPTSKAPILFHDLNGDGWQDHLCRKIAPYLAAIIENPAYTATFALFLQLETNAEREEYLLELGITSEAVDAIAARLGVVDEDERQRHLRWFTAIMQSMGGQLLNDDIEQTALISNLSDAGLPESDAHRIVYAGGGEDVRSDTTDESSLRLLSEANVNLEDLHGHLLQLGDSGLSILDSKRELRRWLNLHARRCAVVLAVTQLPEIAKASVLTFSLPTNLEMSLDPPLDQILEPIAALLRDGGVDLTASALAKNAAAQLANAGGFESVEALDARVLILYDEEEQLRVLGEHAAQWRRELRLLAVLEKTGAVTTRATIRTIDKTVNDTLPVNPSRPSDLMDALADLFIDHQGLVNDIENCMNDLFTSIVIERKEILRLAVKNGVRIDHLTAVKRALEAPRRDHARDIKRRKEYLIKCNLTPSAPSSLELQPHKPVTRSNGPKKVAAIKVSESHDRRKRELGDEGERWAFAAIVRSFLDFKIEMRIKAIEQVIILFDDFEGTPVKAALSHAELARSRDLDDDELIDELTGLLNVSSHSDAFGFDLIGWFPPTEGAELQAMCLEVKSSNGERFHLSSGEWGLAKRFHDAGKGNSYAVLVVRRAKRGGVPAGMDLLVDPVALVEAKQLRLEIDGYMTSYLYQEKKIQGAPLEKDNRQ